MCRELCWETQWGREEMGIYGTALGDSQVQLGRPDWSPAVAEGVTTAGALATLRDECLQIQGSQGLSPAFPWRGL